MNTNKKDNSWGYGIAVAYGIFVILTLTFVFSTFTHKVDLVRTDYYESDLVYSEQMARMENAASLSPPLSWTLTDNRTLTFTFPVSTLGNDITGEISMFRPSDSVYDQHFSIFPDEKGVQHIALNNAPSGYWRVKVLWKSGSTEYYNEGQLMLP